MITEGLYYTKDHEWLKLDGDIATIGITDHAQELLGEVTFIELFDIGTTLTPNAEVASVESSKAASDVYCPLAGEIVEVNDTLNDEPELINQDCYGKGWICRVKLTDPDQINQLMDSKAYAAFLENE